MYQKQSLESGVRKRTVSNPEAFDLDFRPRSYWGPQNIGTWIGSHVKGELRKRQALEDNEVDHFDPEIFSESLSDEHRAAVGKVHPWFMGGEYLPNLLENEVEIARITKKSTTMDVVSIRARKTKHRILYRIVDEYEPDLWEEQYSLTKKTSIKPLSLRELIELIDRACEGGLVGAGREANYVGSGEELEDPEDYYDFETASSAFYPELERWYDTLNEEWLRNERESLPRRQQEKGERLAAEIAAIRTAAEKADPTALTDLGYNHFLGRGVEHSRGKAVECWKRASELGDPSGTLNLATCLRDGIGVAPDQKRALELYERLAEDRFYPGLKLAGYCRHVGIGCEPDRQEALRWYFELAKSAGKDVFSDDLVNCLRNMDGGSIIEKEAINWIREAAELGLAGQNMLAKLADGKTEDPAKHDAGVGWLSGSQPLRRMN
jgi:TPR repeat protein